MWWECSECGGHVERARAPMICPDCGMAGVLFVPVLVEEPVTGVPDAESLRAVWLRAGLERAQTV